VTLKDRKPIYIVTEEEKSWAKSWIEKNTNPNRRSFFGIQHSATAARRSWPAEKQKLLIYELLSKYPNSSVLYFSETKLGEVDEYPNLYYIERFSIRQVAALINECELVIFPDSGLLHLAGALDKKIVGIFGPNQPETRIRYYDNAVGVWLNYPCSVNCWYSRCFQNVKCILDIPVKMVLEKVEKLLKGEGASYSEIEKRKGLCVIRMGGIGDLIMLSSALKIYSEENPEVDITLATLPLHVSLLKGLYFLKDVIAIPELSRFSFDKILDLRWKVESPEVGGTLDTDLYKFRNRFDVFENLVGVESKIKFPQIIVNEECVKSIKKIIAYSRRRKWLGIQVTCTSNTRTIPPEYIPGIIEKFLSVNNLNIILFGKTEYWRGRKPAVDLKSLGAKNVINLIDKLSLEEMVALCSITDFIIGPDSSAIHISGALMKKTLALFGNIDPYTRIFYYPTVKALYPKNELSCVPCWDFVNPCSITDEIGAGCMRLLTPDRIFETAKEWFSL
jgi:ADP-heptose:LPS heptosyltransferase